MTHQSETKTELGIATPVGLSWNTGAGWKAHRKSYSQVSKGDVVSVIVSIADKRNRWRESNILFVQDSEHLSDEALNKKATISPMNKPRKKELFFVTAPRGECEEGGIFNPSHSEVQEAIDRFLESGGVIERLSDEQGLTADVKVPITEFARAGHGGLGGQEVGYEIT